jgi:isoamylase
MFTDIKLEVGYASPFGADVQDDGINFAIPSDNATSVNILLYTQAWSNNPTVVPLVRNADGVWHRFVRGLPNSTLYNLQVGGAYTPAIDGKRFNANKTLNDPWAVAVVGDAEYDELGRLALGYDNSNPSDPNRHLIPSRDKSIAPKCVAYRSNFDWLGVTRPRHNWENTIIYEAHVAGMTGNAGSKLGARRGTFFGLIAMIPELQKLGVTAIQLLPIAEFDPYNREQPDCHLMNCWGYQTTVYGAPHSHYSFYGKLGQQVDEFKLLVREMHRAGIEVILDVVFNHDREGDHLGPTVSLKGLDNEVYFHLQKDHPELYVNHTGCGNTLNANHPRVRQLTMDCLRRWVTEYHIDGFRFDLAATFAIDTDQLEKDKTAIIAEMENDPVLASVKLIAEPWSCTSYRMGRMSDKRWWEWNDQYRDTLRRFVKGDTSQVAGLVKLMTGSREMFPSASGRGSINFVTCHDGFSLYDLVAYNNKHNELNGENNRDGADNNLSWNCGWEGDLATAPLGDDRKKQIESLRRQQMKNFITLLMLSEGTPMIRSGDEIAHTAFGNNNIWCQAELNQLNWLQVDKSADVLNFFSMIIGLRKALHLGVETEVFVKGENETDEEFRTRKEKSGKRERVWHGTIPEAPDTSDGTRFIASEIAPFSGNGVVSNPSVYFASNSYWEPLPVTLPSGKNWQLVVDTSRPAGQDIVSVDNAHSVGPLFIIQPRSTVVMVAKS